jgi:dephospho-CoA kinase
MRIIILNGSAHRGKDQFVNFFKKHYKFTCINWSTIDKVKEISKKYFGWDGKKTDESRKFLSDIKKIWSEYNNGPFNTIIKQISRYNRNHKKDKEYTVYFIHCREPYEIQKFVDKYGKKCITVLLIRDDREVPNNDSDKNVANYKYDYIINNNGNIKDLENESIKFVKIIKKSF